jgi:diacylglycerol O-acyltransferase
MHIGSVGVFEGAPLRDRHGRLRVGAVRAEIESRLHLVPKLRLRVRLSSLGLVAPAWVDDPRFDVSNHVRETTLRSPGTEAILRDLCAELMAIPLRRDRPLWEIWLIDGLERGRVAMIEKLHHSMADGLAGVELVTVLFDLDRYPKHDHSAHPWQPEHGPRPSSILASDLGRRGRFPLQVVSNGVGALRHPVRAGRAMSRYADALGNLVTTGFLAPSSSLNIPIGEGRSVEFIRQRLGDLHEAAGCLGVTINDLLLSSVAQGVHYLLSARGECVEGRTVQVLVPVGADHHGDHQLGNRVSAMLVRLPVGASDPVDRLWSVARALASSKRHRQTLVASSLLDLFEPLPQPMVVAAARLVHRQPFCNLVVTNVPGPGVPLFVLGARMLEAFPLVPIAGNLSVGVAALSYGGQLTVGLLADPAACPGLDVFATGIGHAFSELIAAAGVRSGGSPEKAVETGIGVQGGSSS